MGRRLCIVKTSAVVALRCCRRNTTKQCDVCDDYDASVSQQHGDNLSAPPLCITPIDRYDNARCVCLSICLSVREVYSYDAAHRWVMLVSNKQVNAAALYTDCTSQPIAGLCSRTPSDVNTPRVIYTTLFHHRTWQSCPWVHFV